MKEFIEKLIGRLKKEKVDIGEKTGFSKGINKSIEIVNQLAEEYNGGWIPCSERSPEEATTYQVTEEVIINSKKQYIVDIRLFGTEGEWLCPSNRKIIAWQPLPAPYKEGE